YVNCGVHHALEAPASLGHRIFFGPAVSSEALRIGLGLCVSGGMWGDARGTSFSFGEMIDDPIEKAHPISCFALAGYLGFAALALLAGLPPHRSELTKRALALGLLFPELLPQQVAILGLGQLGQAFLALLYFLKAGTGNPPTEIWLLDRDVFQPE